MTTLPAAFLRPGTPAIRFKPTRAGIIGLWDYRDEEFVFADGRLVLRGHNGSGKTKALEVLFPLVLDGSIDPRRLDPFSGEERTMKSNLLYRSQESAYGYVWMEFTRTDPDCGILEAVTVGIGLLAQKSKERPGRFFFVTDGRIGVDFGLLSADSRPLRKKELETILGENALQKTATAYRDAIDERLFGLGRQSYAQLINLLLQLRRPLLAKDLDPDKLSDTLTAGLRPVDENLIVQAARDFENLAEIQAVLESLTKADSAVQDFLRDYTAYLRAHVRDRIDKTGERIETTTSHCGKIADAAKERREAIAALGAAVAARSEADGARKKHQAHLDGLQNHDAVKREGGLTELRERVRRESDAIAESEIYLGRAQKRVAQLEHEANQVDKQLGELRQSADRHTQTLLTASQLGGLVNDDDPLDLAGDLPTQVQGRVATRRHQLGEVRRHLEAAEKARGDQDRDQSVFDKADGEVTTYERECSEATGRLTDARAQASAELQTVMGRWTGTEATSVLAPADAASLTAALDAVGEPDAPALPEVYRRLTDTRRTTALSRREALDRRFAHTEQELATTRAERAKVAAEHDDAPPASDLRPADRAGRAGAPLWQLVRFADNLPEPQAAAVEGALYGAGLLTAWLHPHPGATDQALADNEPDGYLLPLPAPDRPTGRTLANVLIPEDQQHVPAEIIAAVLASVRLTDDLTTDIHDTPAVTTRAQFTFGIHLGTHPKTRPEYIGATARAARRRERLRTYDQTITDLETLLTGLATKQQTAAEAVADFDTARTQLPPTGPITTAVQQVGVAAGRLADARTRRTDAGKDLDAAIAETHDKERQLRRAAAAASLPTGSEDLTAVEYAVSDFATAAKDLHTGRTAITQTERDLTDRRKNITGLNADCTEQAEALQARKSDHEALAERLSTEEGTLDAPCGRSTHRSLRPRRSWRRLTPPTTKPTRRPAPNKTGSPAPTTPFGTSARPSLPR